MKKLSFLTNLYIESLNRRLRETEELLRCERAAAEQEREMVKSFKEENRKLTNLSHQRAAQVFI